MTGVRAELVVLDPADGSEMWRSPVPDGTGTRASHLRLLVASDAYAEGGEAGISILASP